MRDDDEDVSKRQDGYEHEEVDETSEDAGVEDDEDGNEVGTYQLTHQCVRGRMPAFPIDGWEGECTKKSSLK